MADHRPIPRSARASVAYASYNKPTSITRGTTSIGFSHDPEHGILLGIGNVFRAVPILGSILQIAAAYSCGTPCAARPGGLRWNSIRVERRVHPINRGAFFLPCEWPRMIGQSSRG